MFAVVLALPNMMTSFGADVSSIQWAVLSRHARVAAYADCFLLLSLVLILALIPALLIRATSQASRPAPPPAEPAPIASASHEEIKSAPSAQANRLKLPGSQAHR
jgi:hypothetical protein